LPRLPDSVSPKLHNAIKDLTLVSNCACCK
jgi:hypothetical protein